MSGRIFYYSDRETGEHVDAPLVEEMITAVEEAAFQKKAFALAVAKGMDPATARTLFLAEPQG